MHGTSQLTTPYIYVLMAGLAAAAPAAAAAADASANECMLC